MKYLIKLQNIFGDICCVHKPGCWAWSRRALVPRQAPPPPLHTSTPLKQSHLVILFSFLHWLIFFFPLWQQLHQPWPHWYRISEWIIQVINVHRWLGGRGFFRRIRSSQILSNTLGAGMILWGWFITGVFNMLNAENGPKTNDKSFYKTSQELRNCPI